MGSYRKAEMTGFICRLCSEQKQRVVHLYSTKAKELALMEKIDLLPIKVKRYDNLPKTVCEKCIERLNFQYNLVQRIRKSCAIQRSHRMFHGNGQCPVECPLYGVPFPESQAEEHIDTIVDEEFQNVLVNVNRIYEET